MASINKGTPRSPYRVRWRDADGAERSRCFRTRAEAKVFRAQVEAGEEGRKPTRDGSTMRDWADRWLASRIDLRPSTRRAYRGSLDAWGDLLDRPPVALTPDVIQAAVEGMIGEYAPTTLHRHMRTLSQVCDYAWERGRMAENPTRKVRLPRRRERDMTPLAPSQVDSLVATARRTGSSEAGERNAHLIRTLATTGLRISEALALDWGDVDTEQRRLHVRKGKTAAARRAVPYPSSLAAWFAQGGDGPVWVGVRDGRRLTYTGFRREWVAIVEAWGEVEGLTIHDLRHTCASWLIDAGLDPVKVSRWLGHANPRVTLQVYAHMMPDGLDDAANAIEEIMTSEAAQ